MEVLTIQLRKENGKALKGFVDVKLDSGIIIRAFRIIQEPGRRPIISCPQVSIKEPNRPTYFRTLVILPDELKGQVDLAILNAYQEALDRQKEKLNEHQQL